MLLRFRLARKPLNNSRLSVRANFSYYDLDQKKQVVKAQEVFLTLKGSRQDDLLKDNEVSKNYTIALLAQAIRDMAAACEARRYREAESLLTTAIARTYQRYPNLEDGDITRTLVIAQKYQDVLKRYHQEWDSRDDK